MLNKPVFLTLCLLPALSACTATHPLPETIPAATHQTEQTSGNLIVFFAPDADAAALLQAAENYGASVLYHYQTLNGMALRPPAGVSVQEAAAYFQSLNGVLAVNEDRIMQLHRTDTPL